MSKTEEIIEENLSIDEILANMNKEKSFTSMAKLTTAFGIVYILVSIFMMILLSSNPNMKTLCIVLQSTAVAIPLASFFATFKHYNTKAIIVSLIPILINFVFLLITIFN